MKARITLMVENIHPVSVLGENPEAKIRTGWEVLAAMLSTPSSPTGDTAHVESVEIVDRGGTYKLVSEESEGGEE